MKDKTNKQLFSLVLLLGCVLLGLILWGSKQTTKPIQANVVPVAEAQAEAVAPVQAGQSAVPAEIVETNAASQQVEISVEEPKDDDNGIVRFRMNTTVKDQLPPPEIATNLLARGRERMKANLSSKSR